MSHILSSVQGQRLDQVSIRRALISVSDKTGIVELAAILSQKNVEILSTGGTAKTLRDAGIAVKDVGDFTGFPEILDGRVKTLHPKVHGALLYVRGNDKHESQIMDHGIDQIDLVVMNLYPFEATVQQGHDFAACVENIDIGGPSMMRSASKNHAYVTILSSPGQYAEFLQEFQSNEGSTTLALRQKLAFHAFSLSAKYDYAISTYFATQIHETQSTVTKLYEKSFELKYGCNPHQKPAAIYRHIGRSLPFSVVNGTPGYINLLDACNAWQLVHELKQALGVPAAASFKHCSPAGAAISTPLLNEEVAAYEVANYSSLSPTAIAYIRARNADPMCSFGDFAAISHVVDVSTANVFKTEVCDGIIAPGFEPEALDILRSKKKGGFIILQADENFLAPVSEFREMYGVVFEQKRNDVIFTAQHLSNVVTGVSLPEDAKRDLIVASISIKYTQSNSVGYAINGQMVGVGAGQQSRVDCVKLAGRKVSVWYLRQHPKVLNLPFKKGVKRQDRINARVRYIEGDFTATEFLAWKENFETVPEPLTEEEKNDFLKSLTNVSISSDAFFPFRDSIDHASKYGVKFVAQPGGSVADKEVIQACEEYGMSMAFTDLRLFHH